MTITARPPAPPLPQPPAPPRRRRARKLDHSSTRTLISAADLNRGSGRVVYYVVLTAVMVVFTLAFFFPLYWMVTGAVKEPQELAQTPPTFVPESFTVDAYVDAWNELQLPRFLFNTAFYAAGAWLFQLTFGVGIAYALSKLRPMFGNVILAMILGSLMLPATALLVPAYLTVTDVPLIGVNLLNTPWALWLPAVANAFNIYVLKRFFDQIPTDLLDSASLDGAGRLRTLWHIVLPLSRPVLGVVSIFIVIAMWKDFLWPLLVLQEPDSQTISVALSRLNSTARISIDQMLAALVLASLPMLAVFLAFQRSIISGLSAGGIKG